ncbi:hypothetical protein QN277_014388 [Acacia crassicarpa]|uniref:Uncharacterized protein n=1 Tax=Acacia crassicarpa TaxID=499986 RepID=A0AAE1IP48_9FABA|nr:hypothetical protein QN277_014388 [Acacia crassicarpa]
MAMMATLVFHCTFGVETETTQLHLQRLDPSCDRQQLLVQVMRTNIRSNIISKEKVKNSSLTLDDVKLVAILDICNLWRCDASASEDYVLVSRDDASAR